MEFLIIQRFESIHSEFAGLLHIETPQGSIQVWFYTHIESASSFTFFLPNNNNNTSLVLYWDTTKVCKAQVGVGKKFSRQLTQWICAADYLNQ